MPEAVLHQGDCLEVMPALAAGSVDMVLCDLPYGTTACKWDAVIPFAPLWAEYRRLCRGAVVLTAMQPFTSALVMSNVKAFRHEWIWKKNAGSNFGAVKHQPMREHESVLVFCDRPPPYAPIMQDRSTSGLARVQTVVNYNTAPEVYGGGFGRELSSKRPDKRYPSSIQPFNRERGHHPTQKPVALLEYLIRTYTDEGDTILDNTMGSGSTGVACMNTGRNFIGIERDPGYFAIASKRIAEARASHHPAEPMQGFLFAAE